MVQGDGRTGAVERQGPELDDVLALFDASVSEVHAYVWRRCGDRHVAEDITAETFLAAVRQVRSNPATALTVGWLITVARSKLLNHWRSKEREERRLRIVAGDLRDDEPDDWFEDDRIDRDRFESSLRALPPSQQAALALRYLDGMAVVDVARELGRSIHATESLLARGRAGFRAAYLEGRR